MTDAKKKTAAELQQGLEFVKDLPGYTRGHPHYFKDPMIDHLLEIVLNLGAEIWVSRDRQMIMEHLLATEGKVTPEMIEAFKPDEAFKAKLKDARVLFTQRVYKSLYAAMPEQGKAAFLSGVMQGDG